MSEALPVGVQDALHALLRRCHRHELVPLAEAVRIGHDGVGLDTLARRIAQKVRRAGSRGLVNYVVRGGDGPSYEVVLSGLARRAGLPVEGEAQELEQALAAWVLRDSWSRMDPVHRQQTWEALELVGPPPGEGELVVARARESLGRRYAWNLTRLLGLGALGVGGLVLPLLHPAVGCAALWVFSAPRDAMLLPAVMEIARLRQQVRHRLTIGVLGSPSCGKDSAIGAVFDLDTGGVHPVAGSTSEVSILAVPDATALFVVNTPGLGDVVEEVTREAREVLGLMDLFIYLVNAQGGVQEREQVDFEHCRTLGRPVLVVVNKIDTIEESERGALLAHVADALAVSPEEVLAAAFDPLPQLADSPLGVEAVRRWLESEVTRLGKDLHELPWVAEPESE